MDVELASGSGSSTATPMTSSMSVNGSGVREGDRGSGGAGDAWSLGDWTKFVGAWKKEEKGLKNAGAAISSSEGEKAKERQERLKAMNEAGANDEVVKASAEKLSAVFDWIVDQVPSRSSSPSPTTSQPPPSSSSSSSDSGAVMLSVLLSLEDAETTADAGRDVKETAGETEAVEEEGNMSAREQGRLTMIYDEAMRVKT